MVQSTAVGGKRKERPVLGFAKNLMNITQENKKRKRSEKDAMDKYNESSPRCAAFCFACAKYIYV